MKIVIAGSSGFIGTQVASYFEKEGHELLLLSRKPTTPDAYYWDPESQRIDASILEGADVVINLSGENILGRWSAEKKEKIRESRLVSSLFLCRTLMGLSTPPKLYIGASAIGYYGDRNTEVLTESSTAGESFLSEVCAQWEKIPLTLSPKGIRVVLARFGIVLGKGGALQYMEKGFRTGMGGILGDGKQIMSWIAIDDLCSAIGHVISHAELQGPINFTAPGALSNLEFTRLLGKLLNRPTLISVPKFALTLLLGEGAEIFLASTHVYPQRLIESGFAFQYPELEEALKKYLQT